MNWQTSKTPQKYVMHKRYPINDEYAQYIRDYHNEKAMSACIECKKEFMYPIQELLTGILMYDLYLRVICLPCTKMRITPESKQKWPYANVNCPEWFLGNATE